MSSLGGALGSGKLEGKLMTCPNHGWQFDVTDGNVSPLIDVMMGAWLTLIL